MMTRIGRLYRAISGSAIGELEAHHAEEMLQLERDDLHRQVALYNRGLATHAALCEKLKVRLAALGTEKEKLAARTQARLAADERAAAGRSALRLEQVETEIAELGPQLERAETGYHELVASRKRAVDAARAKIESFKRSIGECRVQTALAELSETAAGMHGAIGISDGRLERLKERVEDKRDLAAARVRVARDSIEVTETDDERSDREADAASALQRFEERRQSSRS